MSSQALVSQHCSSSCRLIIASELCTRHTALAAVEFILSTVNMCIPIIFGCPTKITQDHPEVGRMCPKCHNATVVGGSSRMWFELFWVPLIPFKKSRIWICGTCNWEMDQGGGPDPQPLSAYPQGWNQWGNRPPPPPPQMSH